MSAALADAAAWLEAVLPDGVCAELADPTAEPAAVDDLWPVERSAISSAVEVRRREFAIGRRCARRALVRLGSEPASIPVGPDREPTWPVGITGSITHTRRLVGVVVGPVTSDCRSIGLDVELAGAVDDRLAPMVLTVAEQARCAQSTDAELATTLFSAKEAIYKASFPLARAWLGFHDVEIEIDLERGAFEAVVAEDVVHPLAGRRLVGAARPMLGHVVTTLCL